MKKITFNLFSVIAVLFTASVNAQCLEAGNGLYPDATYTPATCNGITVNSITTLGYAGEYSNVNVVAGETYTFSSSIATDYITISSDDGVTATVSGTSPLTWVADIDGVVRFYTHADEICTENQTFRARRIVCGIAPCTLPEITFTKVSNCPEATFNVTADVTSMGSAAAITITDNQAGSTPQVANGTGLLTFGPYDNGVTVSLTAVNDDSDVCTVTSANFAQAACPPANDDFANAIAIACGNTLTGSTAAATLDQNDAPDGFGADMDAPNVWFSYTGSGAAESITLNLCGSAYDTSVLIYTGSPGSFALIGGNDDDATCGAFPLNTRSRTSFTSDGTSTYYIAVEGYNATSLGDFTMEVTCSEVNPPAVENQSCDTALALEIDNTDVQSDNSFGTINSVQPSCDTFGSIQDVWFSFVAPTEGTVDVTVTNGFMTSANFNVYSGDCGALEAVTGACNANLTTATTESLTGLVAGNVYRVQVWSNAAEQGTFTLRLANPSLSNSTFDSGTFETYPNPVTDVLHLNYDKDISNVEVFNMVGQQVFTKSSTAHISQIDLSTLAKGVYMVKINADNLVKTVKILKQ
ncbi:T9SS type A sorting domain-containing protein [Flavobacterium sp. CYK-4]|uniref:T9SS type A sorting domain-containing protein n=1 Tax=Flavobacterium lotistagni TaxID=2709660 RepID=UPI0014097CE0|nr:T9SS type A sorting domain-containing protein [Flavobacterium lotistagni]NHM06970.1 T9SS type A sorting domain-containing protein [Flavobacterium lotistagni]